MSRVWRKRVGLAAAAWLVLFVISAAADTDPQPILLAGLIVVTAAVVWLATDLADVASPARWDGAALSARRRRGADARVGVLQRALSDIATRHDAEQLHPVLVALVDDRLESIHGINRERDPVRASEALGADLLAFVAQPPPPLQFANHHYLANILTRIEQL